MNWHYLLRILVWPLGLAACVAVLSCSKQSSNSMPTTALGPTKAISFGRRQIDQMLSDRPDMAGILADDDPIVVWIADSMNGDRIGRRVYWNADSPHTGAFVEHALPQGVNPPFICVIGGAEVPAIDKWSGVVYELFNLENHNSFDELYYKAMTAKLDKESYANECAKLEYEACKKTRKFFEEHPIRRATPQNNSRYQLMCRVPLSYDEYLETFRDASGVMHHPGEYFRNLYDESIAPNLPKKSETNTKPQAKS
jgi:hypothetical protein